MTLIYKNLITDDRAQENQQKLAPPANQYQ